VRYHRVRQNVEPFGKEHTMSRVFTIATSAFALLMLGTAANGQVTLNSVRVAAVDSVAAAKFYQSAFGMQEVNRLNLPAGPELFLNFGATIEAAKANKSVPIVIMHRDSDAVIDPIAHVIFNVTDMAATARAVKAAGGSMAGEPRPFGSAGVMIGIAIDPAGNRVELIQRP
jgi:predicted enzyme related to lactoylglutathione lyase